MKIICITPDRKKDYLASAIIEGLYENKIEIYCTGAGNNTRKNYNDNQIIKLSKNIDFVFAFFGKIKGVNPPKHYLVNKINKKDISVYIDGSEWTYTANPENNQEKLSKKDPIFRRGQNWLNQEMLKNCKFYFKRECYPEDVKLGIIPLPFAATKEQIVFGDNLPYKDIDLFCCLRGKDDGLRKEITLICNKLKKESKFKIICEEKLPYDKYIEYLKRSRISIDCWGGGDCCNRFWEIISAKSCCFCQKYQIIIPNPFIDDETYIEFSSEKEFLEKINLYLNNRDKCIEIGEKGYNHMLKYHTTKKRVDYLLNIIK